MIHSRRRLAAIAFVLACFVLWLGHAQGGDDKKPPATKDEGWVGKKFITKTLGMSVISPDGKSPTTVLSGVEYLVLADRDGRVKVSQQSVEGWLAKKDAVLVDDALDFFSEQIKANPKNDYAFFARATAKLQRKEIDAAIADFSEAIRLNPQMVMWRNGRGSAYKLQKDYDKALADFSESMRIDPKDAVAFNRAAWLLAVCRSDRHRDGKKAVRLATQACELTKWQRIPRLV